MINGEEVHMRDIVFVLGVGYVPVVNVDIDGGFTVRMAHGEAHYRTGGMLGNQRRVYWHDPLIIDPPKDRKFWSVFCTITKSIYNTLGPRINANITEV